MRLLSFRVFNFRSVVDSMWVPFSPDGITVFVGQNESGKSSILQALTCALSHSDPSEDDFRLDANLPNVAVKVRVKLTDIEHRLENFTHFERQILGAHLDDEKSGIPLNISWKKENNKIVRVIETFVPALDELLKKYAQVESLGELTGEMIAKRHVKILLDSPDSDIDKKVTLTIAIVALTIWEELPLSVFFDEDSGQLPNTVDINDDGATIGEGSTAADHYLRVAGINLSDLIKKERRTREYILSKANEKISSDFNTFWSQTIGNTGRLSLKCEIDFHNKDAGNQAGKPHLTFWISDGHTQLYPKQRSQGVRWFVSFYLQLKSSELDGYSRMFLLDEPGANLHSKAQGDVLRLINKLGKENLLVVYSTHSPQLVEYSKLFRVHAIQRNSEIDDSPTEIIDAHRLGTASSDTLSPVLTAMGVDLSNHQVIRKNNNVLLEEMSGYYYLSSFWKLTNQTIEAHFIAATGVNKIEPLANMFRGWGLDFIVAVDDDRQGREAYKSMKLELFGDRDELALRKLLKLPNCPGIEDAFSITDFAKFVLDQVGLSYSISNPEYIKANRLSKPVLAFQFAEKVEKGQIKMEDLDADSQAKIVAITDAIASRLS